MKQYDVLVEFSYDATVRQAFAFADRVLSVLDMTDIPHVARWYPPRNGTPSVPLRVRFKGLNKHQLSIVRELVILNSDVATGVGW